jgi:hypothetical protein
VKPSNPLPDLLKPTAGSPAGPPPTGPGWSTWFTRLDACRSLQEGWNGYTAPAPAPVSIDNARVFLEAMQQAQYEPTRLAPSAMGGVAVTRRVGDKKVLVEFYNDGRAFALFSTRPSEMRVVPLAVAPASFQAFVVEMREFLNG